MNTKLDKEKIWHDVLESAKISVSPAIFSTWLSHTSLKSLKKVGENKYLAEIACSSYYIKTTIQERYFGLIQDVLIKAIGYPCDLEFSVEAEGPVKKEVPSGPLFEDLETNEEVINKLIKARLRIGFTFENFAVSGSNQMAHAAAEAVAAKPGITYNPLFIYGGVGVGKTHLMHAVGTKLIKYRNDVKILACSGEELTNDIVMGIRNKTTQIFRDKYRKLDALFVDDIQFIAGKDKVQEEFFHTFNAVTGAGGQIILTSDKPPSEIAKLEERLQSRFEAGLIVDISSPDFELRCAIIQIKAKEKGITLTNVDVEMISGNVETARRIEGFLTRLISESKLKNIPVDTNMIKSILNKNGGDKEKKVNATPDVVIEAVSKHYAISKKALMGQARARVIARPRQMLMYLLRIELGLPLQEVGRIIGGRDHSTVMHAVEIITNLAANNVKTREDIMGIKDNF